MVTGRSSEIDELLGLDVSANDYLKKPFNPHILVARVQALLRRDGTGPLPRGLLGVEPDKLLLLKDGQLISLTTTQFNIFYRIIRVQVWF